MTLPAEGLDLKQYVSDIERVMIEQALKVSNGVVAHAAQLLGLRRTTLVEKMRRFGMHEPAEPAAVREGRREGVGSLGAGEVQGYLS